MKFIQIEIFGFGKWVDEVFHFQGESFIRLYGENEAGKSTLQHFFMYMLFGLPPRKIAQFKPVNSSKIGGRLTIEDESIGTYTIERNERDCVCILSSGEREDEAWLQRQLNGLTRHIYESIYAFSAVDLESIRQMDETELSEILFSVGLTGATHIYELEKELDKRMGKLFKKTGRVPKLNRLMNELNEQGKAVAALKANEGHYREKVLQQKAFEEQLQEKEFALKQTTLDLTTFEKMEHDMNMLQRYGKIKATLHEYQNDVPFPEDGVERYESLKKATYPLQSKLAVMEDNVQHIRNEQKRIKDTLLSETDVQIGQNLLLHKNKIYDAERQMDVIDQQCVELEHRLQKYLTDLELSKEAVDKLVLPFHLEVDVTKLKERYRDMVATKANIEETAELLQKEQGQLQAVIETLEKDMLSHERMEQLNAKKRHYENTLRHDEERKEEQRVWEQWEQQRKKTSNMTLRITFIVALVTFGLSFMSYRPYFLTVTVIALFVGVGLFYSVRRSGTHLQQMMTSKTNATLSATEFAALENTLQEQQELKDRMHEKKVQYNRIRHELGNIQIKMEGIRTNEEDIAEAITSYEKTYPFLKAFKIVHWPPYLQMIREAKELVDELRRKEKERATFAAQVDEYSGKLVAYFQQIDKQQQIVTIMDLENVLADDERNQKVVQSYENNIKKTEDDLRRLQKEINTYETDIKQLFAIARVHDAEAFMKRAKEKDIYRELKQDLEEIEQRIIQIFPKKISEQLLEEAIDLRIVPYETEKRRDTIRIMKQEINEMKEQLTTLKVEISNMESSDDYSKASFQYDVEQERFNDLSEQWAVLKLVETVIVQAKDAYKEKYMEAIIEKTSSFFKRLTNGAYVSVYPPSETEGFQVEKADLTKFSITDLSKGTIDQLYVALRFAISETMSEKYAMPFIIDDAFIHFDDERLEAGLGLLEKVSEQQQVFFFTCNKEVANRVDATYLHELESV